MLLLIINTFLSYLLEFKLLSLQNIFSMDPFVVNTSALFLPTILMITLGLLQVRALYVIKEVISMVLILLLSDVYKPALGHSHHLEQPWSTAHPSVRLLCGPLCLCYRYSRTAESDGIFFLNYRALIHC